MCRRVFGVFVASLLAIFAAEGRQQQPTGRRYTISGRVSDPHNLRPAEGVLMLGSQQGESVGYGLVSVRRNGTFVTHPVAPGNYVLKVVRTPHSAAHPATDVGLTIVEVREADVTGVVVEVRPDTALVGKFRMISDNRAAPWPPHIVVNAFLAMRDSPLLDGVVAEGSQGGKFVLRNAFGTRVLRAGYTLAPGASWWPSRVLSSVDSDLEQDSVLHIAATNRRAAQPDEELDDDASDHHCPSFVLQLAAGARLLSQRILLLLSLITTAAGIVAAGPLLVPATGSPLRVLQGVGHVAIGDVNNDRRPDLVAASSGDRRVAVLLGGGDGQFALPATGLMDVPESPHEIAVGDLRIMLGDGRGRFTQASGSPIATGKGTWRLAVGDVNDDGTADVAASNLESSSLSVWLGR